MNSNNQSLDMIGKVMDRGERGKPMWSRDRQKTQLQLCVCLFFLGRGDVLGYRFY